MDTNHPLRSRIADENTALRIVLEGTANATGRPFFEALVSSLAQVLHTHSAWVTEYLEDRRQLRALAYWADGKLSRDFLVDIAGTPCEAVISQSEVVHYPDHVIHLFPGVALCFPVPVPASVPRIVTDESNVLRVLPPNGQDTPDAAATILEPALELPGGRRR